MKQWTDERIERAVGAADFRHGEEEQIEALMKQMRDELQAEIDNAIPAFVQRVKDRAERNMKATNTVSSAHWNAMRQVLAEMGIEVSI